MPRKEIPLLFIGLCFYILSVGRVRAQDGKTLFQSNCAQCHNPVSVVVGPALKGVTQRVTDRKLLHDWIHNNVKVLASGDVYFNNLYNQYGKAPMNTFPGLSDSEIDAILNYVDNYAQPHGRLPILPISRMHPGRSYWSVYGIVTFILAVFVFGLYLVNSNLKRLAEEEKKVSLRLIRCLFTGINSILPLHP